MFYVLAAKAKTLHLKLISMLYLIINLKYINGIASRFKLLDHNCLHWLEKTLFKRLLFLLFVDELKIIVYLLNLNYIITLISKLSHMIHFDRNPKFNVTHSM